MTAIFIVDDDQQQQQRYATSLSDYVLLAATSSRQARELFEQHQDAIDIIVLDGELASMDPERDTVQLAADFRAAGFAGPMIAASGNPNLQNQLTRRGLCDHRIKFLKSDVPDIVKGIVAAQQ